MEKKNILSKVLATAGTILAWFPIVAPILLTTALLITAHVFRFDFLMPAELFLFSFVGGGLLIWAAVRARAYRKLIIWSFVIAMVLIVGGQALAVVTGLASGEVEPTGWRLALVLGSIVAYSLTLIVTAVGGVLLMRNLFKPSELPQK